MEAAGGREGSRTEVFMCFPFSKYKHINSWIFGSLIVHRRNVKSVGHYFLICGVENLVVAVSRSGLRSEV